MFDIYIPTYNRPSKLCQVVENIIGNSSYPHTIIFGIEEDQEHLYAKSVRSCGDLISKHSGKIVQVLNAEYRKKSYASNINNMFEVMNGVTKNEYFFCASDDLNFHKGWDIALVESIKSMRSHHVFGTNDLMNRRVLLGKHATHFLVSYDYIREQGGVIDNSYPVMFEYRHNFCDSEFIDTAKFRNEFLPVLNSIVEHNHHSFNKSEFDETYQKGSSTVKKDRHVYQIRSRMYASSYN